MIFNALPKHNEGRASVHVRSGLSLVATHGGYKLDDVAFETIGLRKSGDGAKAPALYQEGRWSELVDYCIRDVQIEKELFEFSQRYGYVVRRGNRIPIAKRP